MKSLIKDMRLATGIGQTEAELALNTVLEFFAARLPSPIMGRICEALNITKGAIAKKLEPGEFGND